MRSAAAGRPPPAPADSSACGGGLVALPRYGIELELGGEARDAPQVQREKVEEQSAVGVSGEGNHAPPATLRHPAEDVLQVRRLTGPAGPVVDDLAGDLTRGEVHERHRLIARRGRGGSH